MAALHARHVRLTSGRGSSSSAAIQPPDRRRLNEFYSVPPSDPSASHLHYTDSTLLNLSIRLCLCSVLCLKIQDSKGFIGMENVHLHCSLSLSLSSNYLSSNYLALPLFHQSSLFVSPLRTLMHSRFATHAFILVSVLFCLFTCSHICFVLFLSRLLCQSAHLSLSLRLISFLCWIF